MSDDEWINNLVECMMQTIDQHGWAVMCTEDMDGVPLTYTVGLTFLRSPEFCIRNCEAMTAYSIVQELARRVTDVGAFDKDQFTQVEGKTVKLVESDLTDLGMVKLIFGDNDPITPTALAVQIQ